MGLFSSIVSLVDDTLDVVFMPVKVAVDVTRIGVAPIAALAKEVSDGAGELADEIKDDFTKESV